MKEKVLNLLNLCLTARDLGVCVWFDYSPHVDCVSVYALNEGWEAIPPDEEADREFTYRIYLDWYDAEKQMAAAEQSIKNLIEEGGKSE